MIREAMEKSPGLRAKKKEYEAARGKVVGAWLPGDPEFGVDVEGQPDLFNFNRRMDTEYMVMQRIPFPTKLFLKGLIASKEADIAYQRYKEEERGIIWHVEQPYYELYLANRTLEVLQDNQVLLEQLLKAARARYESNQTSQDEVLKAQIELSKNSVEIFSAKQNLHVQEAHFSHLFDVSLETQYELVDSKERSKLSYLRPELERMAAAARPELKVLEKALERARLGRSLTLTDWLPDITARYEGRQFKGEGSIREHDTFIGITIPVWSLIKGIGGEWRASEEEVKAAEAMYTRIKNEVFLKIHEAHARLKSAENALDVYEASVLPQARQQVEVALASYEAGRTDFLAVIDAQRMLKGIQLEYYKARAEYEMALSDLRLAVGRDLGGERT